MPNPLPFDEDCRDALQEVSNVAMGVAGESLAQLTNSFVQLSIPQIRYLEAGQLSVALGNLPVQTPVSVVGCPAALADEDVYALVAVADSSFQDLGQQMARDVSSDGAQQALLLDIAQTLLSACLPELSVQLEAPASAAPAEISVLAMHTPVDACAVPALDFSAGMLSVEINYHLEAHAFNCDLVLLFPAHTLPWLQQRLAALLA